MAQAGPPPDINVDDLLKGLSALQGVIGFVIFNIDGIPLKRSEKTITAEKAVQYSALISDLWMVARKIIKTEIKSQPADNDLEIIRLRTKQYTELIVSQVGDFYIICIQNCNPRAKQENVILSSLPQVEGGKDEKKKVVEEE